MQLHMTHHMATSCRSLVISGTHRQGPLISQWQARKKLVQVTEVTEVTEVCKCQEQATLHRVVLTVHVSQCIWDKFEKSWSKDAISLWLFHYFHVHYVHLSVTLKHDRRGVELPPTVICHAKTGNTKTFATQDTQLFVLPLTWPRVLSGSSPCRRGATWKTCRSRAQQARPSSAKLGHSSRSFWIWAWRLKEGLILRVFLCSYYSSWNFEIPWCVFLCLWWLQSHCKHQRGTTRGVATWQL